ncbi:MAG: flagellar assembly protein FliW, partial [Gemmatimonadales bacterium]
AQVMVIVNKSEGRLTGNLQGPLVINVATRRGEQVVLSERRLTTRVPLTDVPRLAVAMSA